jgi:hypothetical protein
MCQKFMDKRDAETLLTSHLITIGLKHYASALASDVVRKFSDNFN